VAEIAGINAAKRTFELIPLCHPLNLTKVGVTATLENDAVAVVSEVSCIGQTGVEMEALMAASVALLAVYDMCKAVDKKMQIGEIVLIEKTKTDLGAPAGIGAAPENVLRESARGKIVSVNISKEKGAVKEQMPVIVINDSGVENDAHAGAWHRQVSVLAQESIDAFVASTSRDTRPGEFAENITTTGLPLEKVAIFDRLQIGDGILEVTQIGKECHGDTCAIFREVGQCVMPKEGLFCRVISGGRITPGDEVVHFVRPLRFKIITLSDRASRGEYQDKSGPRVQELIEEFFKKSRWHLECNREILPDEAGRLREALLNARADGVDIVITTGGTGIGPRDITPEVVTSLADRTIPGIMAHIRQTFGSAKPNALLSRSVAVISGRTVIYALPGSVKAVNEYMGEILKTIEHLVFMLHGLDIH